MSVCWTQLRTISWSARLGFLASAALSSEAGLRKRVYLPFGARCLVTCRKPAESA
jgi:hypothetical protein